MYACAFVFTFALIFCWCFAIRAYSMALADLAVISVRSPVAYGLALRHLVGVLFCRRPRHGTARAKFCAYRINDGKFKWILLPQLAKSKCIEKHWKCFIIAADLFLRLMRALFARRAASSCWYCRLRRWNCFIVACTSSTVGQSSLSSRSLPVSVSTSASCSMVNVCSSASAATKLNS